MARPSREESSETNVKEVRIMGFPCWLFFFFVFFSSSENIYESPNRPFRAGVRAGTLFLPGGDGVCGGKANVCPQMNHVPKKKRAQASLFVQLPLAFSFLFCFAWVSSSLSPRQMEGVSKQPPQGGRKKRHIFLSSIP